MQMEFFSNLRMPPLALPMIGRFRLSLSLLSQNSSNLRSLRGYSYDFFLVCFVD